MKSEGTKGRERVAGNAAGDECVFIPGEGPGWADEVGSDTIPDAAGGKSIKSTLGEPGRRKRESRGNQRILQIASIVWSFGFCQAYEYHGQHTFARSRDRRPTIWKCKRCYWTCSTASAPGGWTRESSWPLKADVIVLDIEKFSYKHSSSQRTVA